MTINETRVAVLDAAEELLQTRGFNAFSFRDLADRVQIKAASVHYYFATKRDLCRALIARQREQLESALAAIDALGLSPGKRLERYVGVFQATLEAGNRMCLFGMLASDVATLDPAIGRDLRESFDLQSAWLDRVLSEGRRLGCLEFAGDALEEARLILSSLEGAMLVARVYEDPGRFESATRRILARLRPGPWPTPDPPSRSPQTGMGSPGDPVS